MNGRRHNKRQSSTAFWIVVLVATFALTTLAFGILARPVTLADKLGAHYVIIDLSKNQYRITPEVAQDGKEDFDKMIARLKPYAAITGTYYDADYNPLGDLVANGKVINRGGQKQALGITKSGKIKFLERKPNKRIDWNGYISGIACGPRLVQDGKKDLSFRRDGFSESAGTLEAWRSAVGATKDGKLILCAVPQSITLDTLSDLMLELGAKDAINLDGGSMCAFHKDGKNLVEPVKPVSNLLVVYKTK